MPLKRSLFFLLQRGIGSKAGLRYREIRQTETWTAGKLQAWQTDKLLALLRHSTATAPLYRPFAGAALGDFPILTKDLLARHYRDLMAPSLRSDYETSRLPRRYGWIEVTSGGTTGTPATVIHDANFRDQNRAHRVYEHDLCGFPFGTPHFRLWGSMRDINRARASPGQRAMSSLSGEILLNAFQMDDQHLADYLGRINRSRVLHLAGYVDALYQLALFARRNQLPVRPLRSIMSAAGTLTPEVREVIGTIFQARVHNKYGSRDCGEVACECELGGLHVFSRNVVVEVADEQGAPLPPGQAGRLLITLLDNRLFPMIRVDTGDCGSFARAPCPCGRPFPLLQSVEGRMTDFIRSADGGYVSPVFIRHVIGVVHGRNHLRRFQLVQQSDLRFSLQLQPEAGTAPAILEHMLPALQADLVKVLGSQAQLSIELVANIPETSQGKFQYIINRSGAGR